VAYSATMLSYAVSKVSIYSKFHTTGNWFITNWAATNANGKIETNRESTLSSKKSWDKNSLLGNNKSSLKKLTESNFCRMGNALEDIRKAPQIVDPALGLTHSSIIKVIMTRTWCKILKIKSIESARVKPNNTWVTQMCMMFPTTMENLCHMIKYFWYTNSLRPHLM